ncbi:MAG: tetratricopeptide repeat protein, partial [Thermoplasmata archaeon]|nr:tetratricopeptide repeat protein [Thermoplasmata archaeon]
DYQKVKDKKEITHLFGALRQLLEQVEGTKIIVVGREVPRFFYDERDVSIKKTVKELDLEGLDRESCLKLLEVRGISGDKGKWLYELTKGHPLALELIRETEKFETQEGIKRFMKDEIFSRLTPQERQILEIASVFRFPVYPTAYLAIAGGYPIKDTPEVIPLSLLGISPEKTDKQTEWIEIEHEVIDSLVNKSLLQVSEGVCDIHDLIREFLYSRLPEHTRKELHGKIAKYYLRETTVSSQTILEALYHFLMAEEYKKAAEIAVENGRKLIDYGYWQEILEIIEGIPSESIEPQHRPEILLLRGRIYEIQGKLDKALKDHRQSIRLFRKIRTKTGEATAYRKMGDLMWRQCRWNDAIERYRSALKLSHQTDDIKGVGEAHRGIGRVLWRKGEHDKALLLFEKSLECCRNITNIQMSAKIYTDIGCLLGEKGEHDKAIEYLNKSLSILEEMGDRYEMARAYINLSVVYHKKGKLKDAINWYERAIELGEEIGYVRGVAYGLTNAAEAYVSLGNLEKAREYCDRVLLIFEKLDEKLDEKFLIANTHMVYGIICTKRRDWVSSGEHFEKAIDISTTVDLQYVTAQVHFHYGQMLIRRKNKREAKKHFDESIKIWKKLGNNDMIETVRKEMNK